MAEPSPIAQKMRSLGLTPPPAAGTDADAPAPGPPALGPDGWIIHDVAAWRAANASSVLRAVPAGFTGAELGQCPQAVRDWAGAHHAQPDRYPHLRLHGGTGRGKTHAAWALTKWKLSTAAERGEGLNWRFVTNPGLNDELRPKPDQSHAYAIDKYLRAEWLVLDDLGAGILSDFTVENTLRLLNYRYDQWLPTVYTSNLGLRDLAALFGDRVASRIERATPVILGGPDRRIREGQNHVDLP